jgi:cell wall-associated NlpC family hydrolase
MALRTGRSMRSSVRVVVQAAACSIAVLAALALFGTAGALSPASAQVKAPAKSKLKPPVKAVQKAVLKTDPTDNVADQLNAKWQQENSAFSGFTSAKPAVLPVSLTAPAPTATTPAAATPAVATPAAANEWGDRLVSRAMNYLGTPYRPGGISPSTGFDCSGFVYYLYGAVFGQSIPRMPDGMAREGTAVARSDLKRGDIVFFGYRGTYTHVGIYAGNGQFVHATHRGSPVSVTALDSDYYQQHYMTAVRLSPR